MGVPGFFSWLIRNYKEKSFIIKDLPKKAKILYIDANCLFHPQCFKILESFQSLTNQEKLETYMFRRIMNYINFLINYVNPEIVYISVDGVAPLAKISQQRKRRFKSIEDNKLKEAIKEKYGKSSNNTWSNIKITPGTIFMESLNKFIIKEIKKNKKSSDIEYIYSSYHTVGEGEHKILNDIRKRICKENQEDIYVIYGLDADLFFLSLASQKENIYLLREASYLDNNNTKKIESDPIKDVAEELKYVSIDNTKKCYNQQITKIMEKKLEYVNEKNKINIKIDFNKNFINDFIFLCYLLGNDFLPHLPSIDIKKNGLDFILDCYSETYINTQLNIVDLKKTKDRIKVKINYIVLCEILQMCSLKEAYYFSKILTNKEYNKKCPTSDPCAKEIWELDNLKNINIIDPIKLGQGKPYEWKKRYYDYYFGDIANVKEEIKLKNDLCHNYFEGLEWVSKYYFEGCPSWMWQYKFTHAPFVSDLYFYLKNNFTTIKNIKFNKDSPLEPCVQLLSVLPPTCNAELPNSYRDLVTREDSPIIDMFPDPSKIKIDYLHKEQLWQCIPMIPYLDIERIKSECKKYKLLKSEKVLNTICDEYTF